MQCKNRKISNILSVLQTLKRELQQTTNYVERIVTLQNSAVILNMMIGYKSLGTEIDRSLSISDNLSYQRINALSKRIQKLLSEKIRRLKATDYSYTTTKPQK
jgi:predicted DNA-binding transcriptional regulator